MKKIADLFVSIIILTSIGCAGNSGGQDLSPLMLTQSLSTSGDIDTTFGVDGITQTNPTVYAKDQLAGIGRQSDGKIIVGGSNYISFPTASYSYILIRYNSDGTIDTSFGTEGTGIVTTDAPSASEEEGCGLAVQDDDKIILVGSCYESATYSDIVVIRYNSDGTLDTTFNDDGIVRTNITDCGETKCSDEAQTVVPAGGGNIVVAGSTLDRRDMLVLRYDGSGNLDTTFNAKGYRIISFSSASSSEVAYAAARQNDGKIILAGTSASNAAIVRINTDGSLDGTFGTGGSVIQDFQGKSDTFNDAEIQADGKIVAVGNGVYGSDSDIIIRRYESNGLVDNSFNQGQWLYAGVIGHDDAGTSVGIQSDGKILIGGMAYYNKTGKNSFLVLRVNENGVPDKSFGSKSIFIKSIDNFDSGVTDLLVLPSGSIVACGQLSYNNYHDTEFAMMSLMP